MRGNATPRAWARMIKTRTCLQWWIATRSFRSIFARAAMNTAGFACARPGTAGRREKGTRYIGARPNKNGEPRPCAR